MPDPRVAVVIPIFKQPSLVIDALESVLRQQTSFDYRVVAVNDGCPFAETDQVCRSYARAFPDRVLYVRRKNGGLSAARNTGVAVALRAWPSVEAIQVLDSDDRLGPRALEKAYQALRGEPRAGWVFPNTKRFGWGREYYDTSGPWSLLELLVSNYIACGSMIRRTVFERGLGYDEQMKLGYEDWDLWIQCAAAGMPGRNVPDMEFGYRKRAESMLSGSYRSHEQILAYMRRKHAAAFAPRRALELEQEEFPRFAFYLTDTGRVFCGSDPDREGEAVALEELPGRVLRAATNSRLEPFPRRVVFTSETFLRLAREGHFAAGLLWLLQARLERAEGLLATLCLETAMQRDVCLHIRPGPGVGELAGAAVALAMVPTVMLHHWLSDPAGEGPIPLLTGKGSPRVESVGVYYGRPEALPDVPGDALRCLLDFVERERPAYRELPVLNPLHGKSHYRQDGDGCALTQKLFQAGPLFPRLLDRSRLHIGYVMPVCDFGGAERVSLNLARESRRHGWVPHLFIVGTATARLLSEFRDVFESIVVVDRWEYWKPDLLQGLLGTMDVVVNNNCAHVNEVLPALRRLGVKTFSHLHSVTLDHRGVPCGQPFEALRYEHTLDGVLVISQKLRNWCRSLGMPDEKLLYLPNAPSFEVSEALVDTTLRERAERTADQPLRVMFIGRFDAEKGMDRLVALVTEARARGLPFDWRVVGRRVLGEGHRKVDLGPIEPFLRPPALSTAALSRVYRWADVVVMLSRFEGVPLTILEAQRFGCVVLSTAVGAIDELIEPGRTGYLFRNDQPEDQLVEQILACLTGLHERREKLREVSRAGAAVRRSSTWARSFATLARAVNTMLGHKGGGHA